MKNIKSTNDRPVVNYLKMRIPVEINTYDKARLIEAFNIDPNGWFEADEYGNINYQFSRPETDDEYNTRVQIEKERLAAWKKARKEELSLQEKTRDNQVKMATDPQYAEYLRLQSEIKAKGYPLLVADK